MPYLTILVVLLVLLLFLIAFLLIRAVMFGRGIEPVDAIEGIKVDAPVVALGERSPLSFSNDQPDLAKGLHVSLFNNAWGTNYVQWFGEDTRFRFIMRTV